MWILSTIFLLLRLLQVECWKTPYFGGSSSAKLMKPQSELQNLESEQQFPEQWFTQKLDNFNPNNQITWRQVFLNYFIILFFYLIIL